MHIRPAGLTLACALLGTALSPVALAQLQTTPVTGAVTTAELTGEVVVVDQTRRMLTIRTPEGRFEVLNVPDEVTRLDQVKIGNRLTISQTEAVLIDLKKGPSAGGVGATQETTVERTPGRKPAGAIIDTLTLNGRVESVDHAKSTVTVRGPNQTVTLGVRDHALLNSIAPGDGVSATYMRVIRGEVRFR
ncbi:hypothetical protein [Thiobaca trueperi]|uniref:Uncharacterized protein n=1 Tax=Thiobaca trueperi TaxID=127458 RepID=A0A4R3N132_9GAMM|nr:hypothetical protein [Thiobaca trueperi]TCT22730.1 hypothetical protein EDC35_10261 [Thiobaca trueperi]